MPVANGGDCCAAANDCDDDCYHFDLLSYTCRRSAGSLVVLLFLLCLLFIYDFIYCFTNCANLL